MTGFWMHETSGVLRPAIEEYLSGVEMQPRHAAAMRAYLRQWITGDWALTEGISKLRRDIDTLVDRDSIAKWLNVAIEEGIDPL